MKMIQYTAPQLDSQDNHDRGKICWVCGKALYLQHEPNRVYPTIHNRGSHPSIITVSSVNDNLLAAVRKLTTEYGRNGGNLNQISRSLNEYPQFTGDVRAAVFDIAALKFEVLQKVGNVVGNIHLCISFGTSF